MGTGVAPSLWSPGTFRCGQPEGGPRELSTIGGAGREPSEGYEQASLLEERRLQCGERRRHQLHVEFFPPLRGVGKGQADRLISTGKLNALLRLHIPPIYLVVFEVPIGTTHLGTGFTLRCLQRLSVPDIATQHCPWRDNWYKIGRAHV